MDFILSRFQEHHVQEAVQEPQGAVQEPQEIVQETFQGSVHEAVQEPQEVQDAGEALCDHLDQDQKENIKDPASRLLKLLFILSLLTPV